MAGAFREHQHPRGTDGRFAPTAHAEASITLQGPGTAAARFATAARHRSEIQDAARATVVDELARFTASWFERGGTLVLGPSRRNPGRMEVRSARYTNGDRVPQGELDSLLRIHAPATGASRSDLVGRLPADGTGWSSHPLVGPDYDGGEDVYTVRASQDTDREAAQAAVKELLASDAELASAALDVVAEEAAHGFGDGAQLRFAMTPRGHMVPVAAVRPDGCPVPDDEFEHWFGSAPNGDDPYLPDACEYLRPQDSDWLERTEPIRLSAWETVFAVTVGPSAAQQTAPDERTAR